MDEERSVGFGLIRASTDRETLKRRGIKAIPVDPTFFRNHPCCLHRGLPDLC